MSLDNFNKHQYKELIDYFFDRLDKSIDKLFEKRREEEINKAKQELAEEQDRIMDGVI